MFADRLIIKIDFERPGLVTVRADRDKETG
jgi:hypothetical protein